METNQTEVKEVKEIEFNPNGAYGWNPEDVFTMSGQEFAFMYNSTTSKKKELLEKLEHINILEQMLIKAVKSGIAKEKLPEEIKAANEA